MQTANAAAGVGRDDLATREDLARFATREDFARFPTREDLAQLATREDFARFATKEDLANAFAGLERRLIGYLVALAGLLFAALKLF